ncbi:MAG: DUF1577 domain-containing protein [Leptospira sp.]|nr:DUF1577 domain-containing protein [Leptospira sp.]
MEIIGSIQRAIDYVAEASQKLHVINKYLMDKELTLREYPFETKIKILKVNADATQFAAGSIDHEKFVVGQQLSFYTLLAKYIQINCKVTKIKEDGVILFQLESLGIAKSNRSEKRILNDGTMHVSNLVTVKTVIDANMFQIPTLVKVAFDEFKNRFDKSKFEFVKIDIFKSTLPRRFGIVKKTGKALLIEDTQENDSYKPKNPNLLSYENDIDEDIEVDKKEFREDGILSEIIVPILYEDKSKQKFAMGYIWVQNKENKLQEEHIGEIEEIAGKLIQRIHESNTMTVEQKFPVIDASQSGIQIAVEDDDLKKILPKQKQIVLDIYFKMQPPFTVVGDIRWIAQKTDQKMLLGLNLNAKSDMPGERARYTHNLDTLRRMVESEKIAKS